MGPLEIAAMVGLVREILETLIRGAVLATQKGEMTPEQLADIRSRAALADAEWDAIVARAQSA